MRFLILSSIVFLTSMANAATPLPNCSRGRYAPLSTVESILLNEYSERLFATGRVGPRELRIYVSPSSRTYTGLGTQNGLACHLFSGEQFAPAGERVL